MTDNQYKKEINHIIFLIGFMGSGKTTLGKKLAKTLKYDFIDSDMWIENRNSSTIKQIFENKGEDYFRFLEQEFIENFNPSKPTVVATGGGLPCFNENIERLKNKGIVIYLKASAKILLSRLKSDKSRPLISIIDENEKLTFIEKKLSERSVYYNQAHFSINSGNDVEKQLIELKCLLS